MKRLGDFFSQRQEPGIPGLPVMSVTMNDSLVLRDEIATRLESALRPEEHLLVRKGDIAYNMMRMWQGACGLATSDGIVSPAYVVLAPKPGIDSRFAYHWFKSHRMIYLFWAYSHGLTEDRLRLYFDEFAEIPASPPPLEQQRRIASLLDTWDEGIRATQKLLEAHLRLRAWFRTNLLTGKKRLNGHRGQWREAPLNEILHEHGTRSSGSEAVYSVSVRRGLVNQIEHLGRSFAAKQTAHYSRVLPGDVVYTKSPTGDFPFGILKQSKIDEAVIVSPLYAVFTPANQALGAILDAHFESPIATHNFLYPLVQKGAKNTLAITNDRFLQGKLYLPFDAAEQQDLARVAEAGRDQILRLEAKVVALEHQKRALAQKLLSGEWQLDGRFDRPVLASPSAFAGGAT